MYVSLKQQHQQIVIVSVLRSGVILTKISGDFLNQRDRVMGESNSPASNIQSDNTVLMKT